MASVHMAFSHGVFTWCFYMAFSYDVSNGVFSKCMCFTVFFPWSHGRWAVKEAERGHWMWARHGNTINRPGGFMRSSQFCRSPRSCIGLSFDHGIVAFDKHHLIFGGRFRFVVSIRRFGWEFDWEFGSTESVRNFGWKFRSKFRLPVPLPVPLPVLSWFCSIHTLLTANSRWYGSASFQFSEKVKWALPVPSNVSVASFESEGGIWCDTVG